MSNEEELTQDEISAIISMKMNRRLGFNAYDYPIPSLVEKGYVKIKPPGIPVLTSKVDELKLH